MAGVNNPAGEIDDINAVGAIQGAFGVGNVQGINAAGDIIPENAAAGGQAVAGDINPENAAAGAQAVAGTGGVMKFIFRIHWCCGLRKRSGFASGLESNEPVYFPDWFYKEETIIPKWKMSEEMMKGLLDLEEQDERIEQEDVSLIEKKAEKAVFTALGVTSAIDTVVNLPAIVIAKVGAGVGWSIAVFIPASIGITVACYGAYRKVMRLKHPIKKALVVTKKIRDRADILGIQSEYAARDAEWDEKEAERVNNLKGRGRSGLRAIPGVYLSSVGAIYVLGMLAVVCLCFGDVWPYIYSTFVPADVPVGPPSPPPAASWFGRLWDYVFGWGTGHSNGCFGRGPC